ncbi:MAG: tetratricopeptide repeat protein, partial [Hyphomicrobiales bacterium]
MKAGAGIRVALAAALAVTLAAVGCGDLGIMAERYRVEKRLWEAQRAEDQARLAGMRPDSVTILGLRQKYVDVRASAKLPEHPPTTGPSAEHYRDLFRTVATAELQAARLGLAARRADLALQSADWISQHAGADSAVARQADFLMVGAYRRAGRYDDAIAKIHEILAKYPPVQPAKQNSEDIVLSLPSAAIDIRRTLGDEDGVKKEQAAAIAYYAGLLEHPQPPEQEARIRARYVRVLLDTGDSKTALAESQKLRDQVEGDPSLAFLKPDVEYVDAKVHMLSDKDHTLAISLLQKVAENYPKSSVAGMALFEAATMLEEQKKLDLARQQYKDAAALYPRNVDVAPISLYRQAILEDRAGNWDIAKSILESIPVRYPGTKASAEAPIAIVQRYARVGDKAAVTTALQKAIDTYRGMISQDSTGAAAGVYRWDIFQCQKSLHDWEGAMATVDQLVANHPGQAFTGQALLEGAKIAQANNFKDRAAGFLQQYLEEFPDSPAAAKVREDLK